MRKVFPADVVALVLLLLICIPLFATQIPLQPEKSDYDLHRYYAQQILDTGKIGIPHFLYEFLILAVHSILPGFGLMESSFVVVLMFYLFLPALLFFLIRRTFPPAPSYFAVIASGFLALSLAIITPVTLYTLPKRDLYFGYIGMAVYHNPTMLILRPLALLVFVYAARVFKADRKTSFLLLSSLLVVSTLAKPSYTVCLLPAIVLLALAEHTRGNSVDWKLLSLGIVLPGVLVLGWQYAQAYRSSVDPPGILFAPLAVVRHYSPSVLSKFVFSILFPLCVTVCYLPHVRKNVRFRLCWLTFGFGLFYSYFLAEGGERMYHWNFAWSAQISLFVLCVVAVLFLLRQSYRGFRFSFCAAIFGLHVISGIIWYWYQLRFSRALNF